MVQGSTFDVQILVSQCVGFGFPLRGPSGKQISKVGTRIACEKPAEVL